MVELEKTEISTDAGAFLQSLKRNNDRIREDRAQAISEDAQLLYRREIEDLELQIKRLKRERESLLDLSPTNADSLVLAADFDAKAFVDKDVQLGVQMRNLEIRLDIAKVRYRYLFES